MGRPTHEEVKKLQQGQQGQQAVSDKRRALDKLSNVKNATADGVADAQAEVNKAMVKLWIPRTDPAGISPLLEMYILAVLNLQLVAKKYNKSVNDYELAVSDYTDNLTEWSNAWNSVDRKEIVGGANESINNKVQTVVDAVKKHAEEGYTPSAPQKLK